MRVRKSSAFAHRAPRIGVWGPTCCCSSLSNPASPSAFDSFEPFWTSQIVAAMKSENCRNSDCQFSITAPPKLGESTYCHQERVCSPCAACSALKLCWPANDWPTSVARKIVAKKSESPFSLGRSVSLLGKPDGDEEDDAPDDQHQVQDEHRAHDAGRVLVRLDGRALPGRR